MTCVGFVTGPPQQALLVPVSDPTARSVRGIPSLAAVLDALFTLYLLLATIRSRRTVPIPPFNFAFYTTTTSKEERHQTQSAHFLSGADLSFLSEGASMTAAETFVCYPAMDKRWSPP